MVDISKRRFCQSCGRPLKVIEEFGTEFDGAFNSDYCKDCYRRGYFTEPRLTVDQMVEQVVVRMAKTMSMDNAQVRDLARMFIPRLKRWKKHA